MKVVDDPWLRAGPWDWNINLIQEHIDRHLIDLAKQGTEIGSIVTFDALGVTGDPNHIGVHFACKALFEKRIIPNVSRFELKTIPFTRQYLGFLDIFGSSPLETNFYSASPFEAQLGLSMHVSESTWYRKWLAPLFRYSY